MALFVDLFSWSLPVITVAICMAGTTIVALLRYVRRDHHVPDILGPVESASWLYGNLPELLLSQPYGKFEFKWQEQYGSTYRLKGCFSEDLIFTCDPTALRHIFNSSKLFDFSHSRNFRVSEAFGKESMAALRIGGETHRRIKNAFSPAFTLARLQPYVPVIRNIARNATNKLTQQYAEMGEQRATLDVYHLLQHITSDIIGEVGFGYQFNAIDTDGRDEVTRIHQNVLIQGSRRSKTAILARSVMARLPRLLLKLMLHVPSRSFKTLQKFRQVSVAWATALLRDRLQGENHTDAGSVGFVASANEHKNRERLSFDEISQQTPILLVGGQETTANALAWALYELAKRPTWQDRIRNEIIEAQRTDSTLEKLEYLNAHIKETLRFHASVSLSERVTFEDTIFPLSLPLMTRSGRTITELPLRKGQTIVIGIASCNRNPHIWGPDANVFDPLRWLDGRCNSGNLTGSIGPYSNLATFVGGARVCLGWRLAILELQVVLSEFIPNFQFSVTPTHEKDFTSSLATTLLPLDVRSGKPSLSVVVQPARALN
ncbi:cytochrome P450 [Marasmius fiardii PR-910]|nr:cytochrome P450 [Marasmius fiardii PR-910]